MPPAMLLAVSVLSTRIPPAFDEAIGVVFLVAGAIMVVIGWFVIKRIVEIKV